jgi:hypothetical protein
MNGTTIAAMVITIALLPTILVIDSISTEKRAAEIISDLKTLSAADDRQQQFELLQQKYASKLKRGPNCNFEYCFYEINVSNRPLAMLHLADPAEMITTFQFVQGSLSIVMIEYRVHPRDSESVFVHVQEDYCRTDCVDWWSLGIHPHGKRSDEKWNAIVDFNGNVIGKPRDGARSFNFRCFLPLSYCRDIVDLLPGIWQHNPDGSVRARFRSSGDAFDDWK